MTDAPQLAPAAPPFWSDDFDMDLPKVFPEARALLGDLADIRLRTAGHAFNGRLNHPACWNGDDTMLAYFNFADPGRPAGPLRPAWLVTGGPDPHVPCTAWEMFRDAWPHGYCAHVAQRPVWDTFKLARDFEAIMYRLRGWGGTEAEARRARDRVTASFARAVLTFRNLVQHFDAG